MFESEDILRHEGKYYGLYRAYVFDNKDPQHQGRLRLQIPNIYGADDKTGEMMVSDWAYPMFPIAGNEWGFNYVPPTKNPDGSRVMVWVAFEEGETENPVWVGSPIPKDKFTKDVLENAKAWESGTSKLKSAFSFYTPSGFGILFDDCNELVSIQSPKEQILKIDDTKSEISLTNEVGTISMGDSKISFETKGGLSFVLDDATGQILVNGSPLPV